jgi:thiol-disulfide isomerase/thioredoxin
MSTGNGTLDTLQKIVSMNSLPVLVHFYSPSSERCQIFAKHIDEAQKKNEFVIFGAPLPGAEDLQNMFSITKLPSFVFLRKGSSIIVQNGANGPGLTRALMGQ